LGEESNATKNRVENQRTIPLDFINCNDIFSVPAGKKISSERKTMKKVSWGILSTAKIGVGKVIPSMQKGKYSTIVAISSRDAGRARLAARKLGIPKAYGSYEDLLADPEVGAVYNPLPNNLHAEWTLKCLQAGKHVLLEKPLTMNYDEAAALYAAAKDFPHLKVMEAFMYRHHPQMGKVRQLIRKGVIGEIRSVHASFSYHNTDPQNIRNRRETGGGGLLDIGCYCVSLSRFVFDAEPRRVCATIDYDLQSGVDRLVSAVLEFPKGTASLTCATQMTPHQYAKVFGTKGHIEIIQPFTPPGNKKATIVICPSGKPVKKVSIPATDHYTAQGDLFSKAILTGGPVFTPLEDAVANMKVLTRIQESASAGTWITV
jgi:predicted dehydrogenase